MLHAHREVLAIETEAAADVELQRLDIAAKVAVVLGEQRPGPLLTEDNGYLSCNVEALELDVGSGFSLDGEDFPVGVQHQLHLSAGPELSLLRP